MKILYVINALTVGGAQTLLFDAASFFLNKGCEVYVAAFRGGIYEEKLKLAGVKVVILGEFLCDISGTIKLIKLIKRIDPDIIHSHLFRASMWARIAGLFNLRSKIITTVHGKESWFYSWLEKYMYDFSDKIVFSSRYLLEWYNNDLIKNSLKNYLDEIETVLYPGVEIYKKSEKKPLSDNQIVIGTMSRLHKVKGIDFLLRSIARIKHENYKLIIAGDGIEKRKLINTAKELKIKDKCEFVGHIEDKKKFFSRLNLFVAPSREEGFGINICEAMERNVPVFASDVGGIKEIIKDGYNGKLFVVNNNCEYVENFANMLDNVFIKENRKQIEIFAENGRETVEQKFNRENTLVGYMNIYNNLVCKKNKIHFLISSPEMGGGEHLALGLMKSLIERGYTVSLTCAGEPLKTAAQKIGVSVSCQNMSVGGLLFALKAAKDIIRIKPDCLSLHLNKAGLIGGYLGKLFGIKTLAHVHGLNRLSYYKKCDKIIAVSRAVKEHICKQGKAESEVELICNCIDKPALKPKTLGNKPVQIAITAKLHINKGHEWALNAIKNHINELNIDCIHVLGDGPEKENLHKLCSDEPLKSLVKFYGHVSDVDEIYENIDIALLPSAGEGIPLSLLESMRFGIPCIATNRGGIPEIVSNEENGLLIEYGDEKALIEAINKLSNKDNYKLFSENAINAFKRLNNYEKMVDDFEKLL